MGQPSVVAGRRVVRPALRANVDECSLSLRPEGHASLSGRAGRRRLGNLLGVRMTHAFYIGRSPISSSIYGILLMPSAYYPKRTGEYVYDVTVSKDETRRLSRRYCARLSNAERIENGRLVSVQIDVKDAYGPTLSEAMRALDASFDTWRREQLLKRQPWSSSSARHSRPGDGDGRAGT